MNKRIFVIILSLIMVMASLTGCDTQSETGDSKPSNNKDSQVADNNDKDSEKESGSEKDSTSEKDETESETEPEPKPEVKLYDTLATMETTPSSSFEYNVEAGGVYITNLLDTTTEILVFPEEIDGMPVRKISIPLKNFPNVKYVYIPEAGIELPGLYNAKSLVQVEFGKISNETTLKEVLDGCESLVKVVLPEGLVHIGERLFDDCTSLECVSIPTTVTTIGRYAFVNCVSLATIDIPDAVTKIDVGAFSGCKSLEEISLPSNLGVIELNAFANCPLRKIVIPASVKTLVGPFSGCNLLESIIVEEGNTNYASRDANGVECNAIFNGEVVVLHCATSIYPEEVTTISGTFVGSGTKLVLPDHITKLNNAAFEDADLLEKITLSKGLEKIPTRAFQNCDNLREVVIPDTVTKIDQDAFYGCISLEKVHLSEGLKSIGVRAFYATGLKEITIPSTVTNIHVSAFADCAALEKIYVEEGSYAEQWVKDSKFASALAYK